MNWILLKGTILLGHFWFLLGIDGGVLGFEEENSRFGGGLDKARLESVIISFSNAK